VRRVFAGPAEFASDPSNLARVGAYVADMTRPYGLEPQAVAPGQSYGEMAGALIGLAVSAAEPVDLLVLAFAIHDLRPGRPTAAYLSHLTPGAPMAFAICDQGPAATFTGLRIASEYASTAGLDRALVIAVEQAALSYDCQVPLPARHQAVALLFEVGPTSSAGVAEVRQQAGVAPGDAAGLAAAQLADLTASHDDVALVLGDSLAAIWIAPAATRVRRVPAGQPATGVWWGLIDELNDCSAPADLVVVADYDPALRYLCLTGLGRQPLRSADLSRRGRVEGRLDRDLFDAAQ
jgi:4-hydroxymandelate oxidase